MRTNANMRILLRDPTFAEDRPTLPQNIQEVVDAGWVVGPNGALILASFVPAGTSPTGEPGRSEYDVNDVYISLDDLDREGRDFLPRAAARGFLFATSMLAKALDLPESITLLATVGVFVDRNDPDFSLQGTTVRFFTRRGDYPTWFEDLEGFKLEAIAVLDTTDPYPVVRRRTET